MAAMSSVLSTHDGDVTDELVEYYRVRAKGGAGLITVEFSGVLRAFGRAEPQQLMLDRDSDIDGHRRLVEAICTSGSKAAVQLHSPGQYSHPSTREGLAVAPSAQFSRRDATKQLCRALTEAEIFRLVDAFGASARRAVAAGYEAIEIHGAHGYLPQAFLSPLKNLRDDAWGGDEERRLRFALEIIGAVRDAIGPDRPLIYRLSSAEYVDGGLSLDDMVRIAPRLVAAGVDILNVSSGTIDGTLDRAVDPMSVPEGWRFTHSRALKDATGVPVMGPGPVRWPETGEAALADGNTDIVALGRPLLADPEWPNKAFGGQRGAIRPCTNCNWCFERVIRHEPIGCAENPLAGRELQAKHLVGGETRVALVVGAGPGGMAAALDLAEAGFETDLFEARTVLGGGLTTSGAPPLKDKLFWYRDHLIERLDGSPVRVHLATSATANMLAARHPDLVVLATGAQDRGHLVDGDDLPICTSAYDLLTEQADFEANPHQPIIVYGGGETGCETAEYLAQRGHQVVLITRSGIRDLARSAEGMYRKHLISRLRNNPHILIRQFSTIVQIQSDGIVLVDAEKKEDRLHCRKVVMAQGRMPGARLEEELAALGIATVKIGDAEQIGRIGDAVHAARNAVTSLLPVRRGDKER